MAGIIEFMGVSGVGKSTTYNYLRSKNPGKSGWLLHDQLWKEQHSIKKNFKKAWKRYIKDILNTSPTSHFSSSGDYLKKFIYANRELNDRFWQTLYEKERKNGQELRFHEVEYIRYLFEKIQRVREYRTNSLCIIDEGLIHNLNYFTPETTNSENISAILDLFDPPEAVIFFCGELDTVMERLSNRGKVIKRDRELNEEEILESRKKSILEKNITLEVLQKRNIPVLQLDAQESISNKSKLIISFLTNTKEKPVLKPLW